MPANDLVDAYAKAGAQGGAEPQTSLRHLGSRQYSQQDVVPRLENFDVYDRPVHSLDSSAECLHSGLCRVNAEVIAELKAFSAASTTETPVGKSRLFESDR